MNRSNLVLSWDASETSATVYLPPKFVGHKSSVVFCITFVWNYLSLPCFVVVVIVA
jgi:hypothetical protein